MGFALGCAGFPVSNPSGSLVAIELWIGGWPLASTANRENRRFLRYCHRRLVALSDCAEQGRLCRNTSARGLVLCGCRSYSVADHIRVVDRHLPESPTF